MLQGTLAYIARQEIQPGPAEWHAAGLDGAGASSQDNQFDGVAKRDVEQRADGISHVTGNTLGGMAEQPGQGNDGDGVHGKDDAGAEMDLGHSNADGHEDEEQVDLAVQQDHLTCAGKPDRKVRFAVGGFLICLVVTASVYDRPLGCSFRCRLIDLAIVSRCEDGSRSGRAITGAAGVVTVVEIMMLSFEVDALDSSWLGNRVCEMMKITGGMMRVYGLSTACASVWRRAAMRSGPEAEAICISQVR